MAKITDILSGKVFKTGRGSALSIDYPQAGESVGRGHYAVRVSAGGGECEISIDDGPWQACRSADGFSWYDWSPEQTGSHRISVRTRVGNGWVKTDRTCKVK